MKLGTKEVAISDYEGVMRALGFTLLRQSVYYDEKEYRRLVKPPKAGVALPKLPKPELPALPSPFK